MNYFFHPEADAEFIAAIDYYEGKKTVYILAVMHLRREPNYWKKRII